MSLLYAGPCLHLGPLISHQPCEVSVSITLTEEETEALGGQAPSRPSQSGTDTPECGLKTGSVSEGRTVVATFSVLKEGAEVGESRQLLPENWSLGPRARPTPAWSGMAVGGCPSMH